MRCGVTGCAGMRCDVTGCAPVRCGVTGCAPVRCGVTGCAGMRCDVTSCAPVRFGGCQIVSPGSVHSSAGRCSIVCICEFKVLQYLRLLYASALLAKHSSGRFNYKNGKEKPQPHAKCSMFKKKGDNRFARSASSGLDDALRAKQLSPFWSFLIYCI